MAPVAATGSGCRSPDGSRYGVLEPDGGTVTATAPGGRARIGLLHQEPPFAAASTIAEALESAVAPQRAAAAAVSAAGEALAGAAEDDTAAATFAAGLEAADHLGAWTVDTRIRAVLSGLGLDDLPAARPTGGLSGGQRSRLSLAWLLLSAPDVLLLDEPTNHLDDEAARYLRDLLGGWPGPVLIASHDRAFLDDTVTSLLDLDPAPLPQAVAGPLVGDGDGDGTGIGVVRFTGTYTDYLHARLDARERWEHQYRAEQAHLGRLRCRPEHLRGGARGLVPALGGPGRREVLRRPECQDRLPARSRRRRPARAAGGTAGPSTARRVAFPGPHGRGHAVGGTGRQRSGTRRHGCRRRGPPGSHVAGRRARGEVADHRSQWFREVDPPAPRGRTPRSDLGNRRSSALTASGAPRPGHRPPGSVRRGAERTARQAYEDLVGPERAGLVPLPTTGLIAPRDENRPVNELSVGQQQRLALAVLLASPPDLLLLDEPANHLSLLVATQLEAALPDYPGAVLVASHDRWLRRTWTGRHLDLTAGQAHRRPGA